MEGIRARLGLAPNQSDKQENKQEDKQRIFLPKRTLLPFIQKSRIVKYFNARSDKIHDALSQMMACQQYNSKIISETSNICIHCNSTNVEVDDKVCG